MAAKDSTSAGKKADGTKLPAWITLAFSGGMFALGALVFQGGEFFSRTESLTVKVEKLAGKIEHLDKTIAENNTSTSIKLAQIEANTTLYTTTSEDTKQRLAALDQQFGALKERFMRIETCVKNEENNGCNL